ncbi:MAG: CIC family chloride channel protein [Halioglobus sp.]
MEAGAQYKTYNTPETGNIGFFSDAKKPVRRLLNQYRLTLTNHESTVSYAILGVVGGIASGFIVLLFERAIAGLAGLWGVGSAGEGFELLPLWAIFCLPVIGALVLGLAMSLIKPEDRETGIVHVLSSMNSNYGVLSHRNAIVQFFCGAFAIATGQSGGREGPGVHLGAAINSKLGQKLGLPNNSLRVLIACGTAGGIAAAFNTPLAGVIFAMEVVIAEYTVVGFIPVIMAAISASAISRTFSGGAGLFLIPEVSLNSLWEIPYIVLLGICCGIAVSLFITISKFSARLLHWPIAARFTLAGLLTGSLALLAPEILGMGYDTLNLVLHEELAVAMLITICLCKILATSFSSGIGMPIGVIGPSLLIGACVGGILGLLGQHVVPELASDYTLYIVIGMAAAMGAILNAPLAAILAVIELTQSISIAMPALLAIVAATLTNTGVFRQRSAHQTVLSQLRRLLPNDPVSQLLHRTDVSSSMERSVNKVQVVLRPSARKDLLKSKASWCLIQRDSEALFLVKRTELVVWISEQTQATDQSLDLTEANIRRWTISRAPIQATLRQALDIMRSNTAEAALVYGRDAAGKRILHGIVTRETIEKFSLSGLSGHN